MASSTPDDGFHEIQLNGKQLVFLFMAATVVSVVIFLCGVLVGRGVRTERTVVQSAALNESPAPDVRPSDEASVPAAIQAGADPRVAAPPPPGEERTDGASEDIRPDSVKAAERVNQPVEKPAPPTASKTEKADKPSKSERTSVEKTAGVEKVAKADKPASKPSDKLIDKPVEKPSPKPFPDPAAAVVAAPKEPAAAPPTQASAASGDGYAVQVAAVNVRTDADAIAKRFSSKGYSAYVEVPPNGTATVFRVRIGTFKTKREAETIAAKLQKEEQIKPWVTR